MKTTLYQRLMDRAFPLSWEERLRAQAETDALREYERLLSAEAERVELENRARAAEIALVEEANQRERDRLDPDWRTIVIINYPASFDEKVITIRCLLEENRPGVRRVTHQVINDQSTFHQSEIACEKFLASRISWVSHVDPWLKGHIDTKRLMEVKKANLPFGDLKDIVLVGEKS